MSQPCIWFCRSASSTFARQAQRPRDVVVGHLSARCRVMVRLPSRPDVR